MEIRPVPRLGRFRSPAARARYSAAYDRAMAAWPSPRRQWDVETPHARTRVQLHDPGHPPGTAPYLLLNGKSSHASAWHPNVPGLAAVRPVLAVDTPGEPGRTRQRRPLRTPADFTAWLAALVDGLDAPQVHAVGRSYGGWIALAAAADPDAGKRLASAALLDPAGLGPVPPRFYGWMAATAAASVLPHPMRARLAGPLRNPMTAERAPLAAARAGTLAFRGALPVPRAFTDAELRAADASGVPLLVLLGEHTALHDPHRALARVRALLPGAVAEIVPGTGHSLNLDRPGEVNSRINSFTAPPI